MASALEAIASRVLGQYPISVATSLALESAFGHYPEKPPVNPAPIMAVKNIWFNVRTLIRNFIGALPTDYQEKLSADDIQVGLMEEMNMIEQVVATQSQGYCNCVFYMCDYSRVVQTMSSAWHKTPKTPKQILYSRREDKIIKSLSLAPIAQPIRKFNYELRSQNNQFPKSFIVTHLPIDLLSRYSFQSLQLLESHTGAIKNPGEWNTKLTNGAKELPNIPFNRFTLQLFGDNGHMFHAGPQRLRDIVLHIAKRDQWTSVTTSERVSFSVRNIPNDVDRGSLMKLM
ncbi:MAG TPA: hypothetical protein VN081_01225 [Dongiaceae bacterium]|nr:hypothetical protein [Dongiaceae bacterium]